MKNITRTILALVAGSFLVCAPAFSEAEVGSKAPAFTATTTAGQTIKLSDYKGKYVVLEWTNHECPFVQGQYTPGKMQAMQQKWTGKGVVWLSICSSAPGNQGNLTPQQMDAKMKERNAHPTASIVDPSGDLGHLFGAKTTPHMFVIDPAGKVVYEGAIDDKASKNYVDAALTESMAGKSVSVSQTKSYGCSVKYAK